MIEQLIFDHKSHDLSWVKIGNNRVQVEIVDFNPFSFQFIAETHPKSDTCLFLNPSNVMDINDNIGNKLRAL